MYANTRVRADREARPRKPVTYVNARVRVDREEALTLHRILWEERSRLIARKIEERDAGHDVAGIRAQLQVLRRMHEEVKRALEDLGVTDE